MNDDASLEILVSALRHEVGSDPFDLAVVLGSGLGPVADQAEETTIFAYSDFACFPTTTVAGHTGRLVAGRLHGWRVLLFQGRFHTYEGYNAWQVAVPVRLAHRLGCPRLLLTNAAGGIRTEFAPGDFMFIDDHLNLLGDNPLRGLSGNPFVDLSAVYRQDLFPPLQGTARRAGLGLHRGILAALPGPSYETPAEVRMLRLLGADAVSMSTVPEAIMARYLGLEVAGLSLIANAAAGLQDALSHQEVLESATQGARGMSTLLGALIPAWRQAPRKKAE